MYVLWANKWCSIILCYHPRCLLHFWLRIGNLLATIATRLWAKMAKNGWKQVFDDIYRHSLLFYRQIYFIGRRVVFNYPMVSPKVPTKLLTRDVWQLWQLWQILAIATLCRAISSALQGNFKISLAHLQSNFKISCAHFQKSLQGNFKPCIITISAHKCLFYYSFFLVVLSLNNLFSHIFCAFYSI
jgi:hypothetical protein